MSNSNVAKLGPSLTSEQLHWLYAVGCADPVNCRTNKHNNDTLQALICSWAPRPVSALSSQCAGYHRKQLVSSLLLARLVYRRTFSADPSLVTWDKSSPLCTMGSKTIGLIQRFWKFRVCVSARVVALSSRV